MVSTRRARALTCADSPEKTVACLPAPPSTERVEVVASFAKRKSERPSKSANPPPQPTPAPIQLIPVPVEVVVAEPQVENVPERTSAVRPIKPGRPRKRTIIRTKSKSRKGRNKVKHDKDAALDQRRGDLAAEPNICERCQLDNTTMDHFFRKHNGLLTEQEKNLSIKEKRKFWSRTVTKKYKLHCQRTECGLPVASSTAMVYHAKTCGVVVEKKPCPYCQKEYSVFTITQHINEHDRSNGEWKRKGKYRDGLEEFEGEDFAGTSQKSELFGPAPHDVIEMSSPKKTKTEKLTKIRESKRYQQRHKRQSTIRAGHRFQSSDEEEDDSQESVYDDDEDSDGEESDDSEDETEPSTSRRSKNSLKGSSEKTYSTKFTSSANFPRLYAYWKRSLEALGYAKCEMSSCDAVTATLPEMVQHHKTCVRSKTKLPPGVAKHSFEVMRCHQCKYRTHAVQRMVRHYQKSHEMSLEQAEEKAEQKKLANSSWQLTQKEYDDLRLFE